MRQRVDERSMQMSLLTLGHGTLQIGTRDLPQPRCAATIERFARFALTMLLFTLIAAGIVAVKSAIWNPALQPLTKRRRRRNHRRPKPQQRRRVMGQSKPPSSRSRSKSLFYIGRNSHGHWVVQDEQRLRGGLFVDRTEALKFALFENGHRPQAVVMVPGVFELDMSGRASPVQPSALEADAPQQRRAA